MGPAPDRETHIYKVVDGYQIKADVFGASVGANKPAVVWIHGGGLIFGSRTTPRPAFLAALLHAGIVAVSIDHRLAPETKLADIVDDVRDAWQWVVEQGPTLLGIDPERVAMAGASSGAYLTLMSGYCAKPRPRALAAFAGFGDITTPWEAEPSAHYLEKFPRISREEAVRQSLAPPCLSPAPVSIAATSTSTVASKDIGRSKWLVTTRFWIPIGSTCTARSGMSQHSSHPPS